ELTPPMVDSHVSHVLVIDDDPGTLQTFSVILRLAGFGVSTALSGLEALSLARRRSLDLILMDLRLQDMDGVEILRVLRAEQIEVAVVVMTAFGSIQSAVDALKLGAKDYVEKPLDDVCLLDLVRRMTAFKPAGVPATARAEYSAPVAAARAFLEQHYARPLTYAVIGDAVGRDPEYLERRFRHECGVTMHAYLAHVRLTKAYELANAGQKIESLPAAV